MKLRPGQACSSHAQHRARRRRASRRRRGFTLVELMVTLAGGLFVSIGVFMVAKNTSALYQRETRIANANLASLVGFERLRADIARAGFMASPHVRRDPFVCGTPVTDATWPTQLRTMTSIRIDNPTAVSPMSDNGLSPQAITIAGNFTSTEAFPIRAVFADAGDFRVHLQVNSGPLSRLGYNEVGANRAEILSNVFPVGRAVRIVDKSGRHQYGTIESLDTETTPIVTLAANSPNLIFRESSALGCGLKGEETGALINTVNFIRYRIASLAGDARYAPIYAVAGPEYDDARTELIREELDPTGAVIANSAELVAEYAVDLRFGLTVARSQRQLLEFIDDPGDMDAFAGNPTLMNATSGPQMIRTVHAWLSVRSREADRTRTITVDDGPLYRIGLGDGPADGEEGGDLQSQLAPYARVRTVQARIALHNQTGVTWQ